MARKKTSKKANSGAQAAKPPKVPKPTVVQEIFLGDPQTPPSMTVTREDTGETRAIVLTQLPVEVKIQAAFEGMWSRIKRAADPLKVTDQLIAGEWPKGRQRGGAARIPIAVEALARVTGRTLDQCKETWARLDADAKKAVQKDMRIKAMVAQLKAERAEGEGSLENILNLPTAEAPPLQHQQSASFD